MSIASKNSPTTTPFAVRERIIADAIAAGTHSPIEDWRTVCDGCRQWVGGMSRLIPSRPGA